MAFLPMHTYHEKNPSTKESAPKPKAPEHGNTASHSGTSHWG